VTPGQEAAPSATAQEQPKRIAEGYVTALSPPDGFTINGNLNVTTGAATHYEWFNHNDIKLGDATQDAVQIGAHVKVLGAKAKEAVTAETVRIQDEADRKIHGFGLVDKVIAPGPEPVFRADGFLLHIEPNTEVIFAGGLKTVDDVNPGTWMRYEGKRDKAGNLIAARAEFAPGISGAAKAVDISQSSMAPDAIPANAKIIDSNGNFEDGHGKVRISDSRGWCGWHRLATDQAMQERVRRVGMSVVPAFQRQLASNDAARIHFRFYAVDEPEIHTEFLCKEGVILVPLQLAGRLQNDDELATVLADGVAFSLQLQETKVIHSAALRKSAAIAEDVLVVYDPLDFVVVDKMIVPIALRGVIERAEEQRGRMALAFMQGAGYDPWQAPEAWRLLSPKKLPTDTSHLKYPNRAGYQLAILNLQYARDSAAKPDPNGAKANAPQPK